MTTGRKWMIGIEFSVFALTVVMSLAAGQWVPVMFGAPVLGLAVWDLVRR